MKFKKNQFEKKTSLNNSEKIFQKFCLTKAVAGVLTFTLILEL